MQHQKIRLNPLLSGSTMPINGELRQFGGYYAYGNVLGGGIVNTFNVRQFLNDANNQALIDDFKSYLSRYTTESEMVQIIGSNEKLSEIFNEFYEMTVMQSIPTSPDVISGTLTNSFSVQGSSTDHQWNGISNSTGLQNTPMSVENSERDSEPYSISTQISMGLDYHIPVFIRRSYKENTKDRYDGCPTIFNQLLSPDLFSASTPTIEGEGGSINGPISVANGDGSAFIQNRSIINDFSSISSQLIERCYDSDCIDNRYCDFLRNGKALMEEGGEDKIRSSMSESTNEITESVVLSIVVNELSLKGYPVVDKIYQCLLSENVKGPMRGLNNMNNNR